MSKTEKDHDDMSTLWGGEPRSDKGGHPRAAWFRASKYAMFIHFGLYSEAAGVWKGKNWHGIAEWLMRRARIPSGEYESLAARFDLADFDANEIAGLAKAAGMRYIVLTAKHHEGFAMFKSEVSPYNVVDATPFGRDVAGELAAACRAHGLEIGFYYSQYLDWHEPDAAGNDWEFGEHRDFQRYFRGKALPQITELLTNYGPVALIWFDTPGNLAEESSRELCDLVHRLQPACLVNSRVGNGLGDYSSLGDQEVPLVVPEGLWETVDTHNDTWAYNINDHHWKSSGELISRLVRVASLGGTYMLNVGPTGRGVVPTESAEILLEVGKWLELHADSIYDSLPSPIPAQPWGVLTAKPGNLYLHVLHWPAGGRLIVPGLSAIAGPAVVMATGRELPIMRSGGMLVIEIPEVGPVSPLTVITIPWDGGKVSVCSTRLLHPGLSNTFDAPFARTSGCRTGKRQWMEKFGDWHHADVVEEIVTGSTLSWDLSVVEEGLWNVELEYECLPDADGSELEFSLGANAWRFPVHATGSRHAGRIRMRRETLGMVKLPGSGGFELSLRGTEITAPGAILIRRAVLSPA